MSAGPLIVKMIIINSTDGLLILAASNLYKLDQEDQGKGQRVQTEGVRRLIEDQVKGYNSSASAVPPIFKMIRKKIVLDNC